MNCYVLCGGRSSRMGVSKQELELGGSTFLHRVHAEAEAVFEAVIAVTKPGRLAPGVRTIHEDETEHAAPILGLARAAADAGDEPFFVLAVDYPLITREVLRFVRERFESSDFEIVAPKAGNKVHVLCAGYRPSVYPTLLEKIRDGQFRLQGLLDQHRSLVLGDAELAPFGEALLNVNTNEDLERARRIHG